MADGPQLAPKLQAPANGMSPYERLALVCAIAGVLCCALAGWMAWKPLAPLTLGVALLYVAYLGASGARAEAWMEKRKR